jgi:N-dimethylarginine dimethylaminohydrolase
LRAPSDSKEALHLDCAYAPIGNGMALIHPGSIDDDYKRFFGNRVFIEVTDAEQSRLATNILSIAPDVVVARNISERINHLLSGLGIEVIELKFDGPPQLGGSFRCCTMPILRATSSEQ